MTDRDALIEGCTCQHGRDHDGSEFGPCPYCERIAATNCDWPALGVFRFFDEPGEHDPCYVVMPDGASLAVNHHAGHGVDIARAKFIVDACNVALFKSRSTPSDDYLLSSSPSPAQWPEDVVERAIQAWVGPEYRAKPKREHYANMRAVLDSVADAIFSRTAALATLPPPAGSLSSDSIGKLPDERDGRLIDALADVDMSEARLSQQVKIAMEALEAVRDWDSLYDALPDLVVSKLLAAFAAASAFAKSQDRPDAGEESGG